MEYTRTNWESKMVIGADNLNNIEEGIVQAASSITDLESLSVDVDNNTSSIRTLTTNINQKIAEYDSDILTLKGKCNNYDSAIPTLSNNITNLDTRVSNLEAVSLNNIYRLSNIQYDAETQILDSGVSYNQLVELFNSSKFIYGVFHIFNIWFVGYVTEIYIEEVENQQTYNMNVFDGQNIMVFKSTDGNSNLTLVLSS